MSTRHASRGGRSSALLRTLRWLWSPTGLIVTGFVLRLAFILEMGNHFYFADTLEYEAAANNLLHGHLPDAASPRAPLYPALMAIGIAMGGLRDYPLARLLQLPLAMSIVLSTGRIARRLGGAGAERLALFGAAWAPTLVFVTGMLYPTTLYTAILLGITEFALSLRETPSTRNAVALGVLLPLGWLTDQVILAPVSAILLWLAAVRTRTQAGFTRALLIAMAISAAIATPYVLLQREAYGHRAIPMQKAQYVLYWARSDHDMDADRRVHVPVDSTWKPLPTQAFLAQEWHFIRTQPADYAHDVVWEFLHFFKPMPDRVQSRNHYNQSYILLLGAIYFLPVLCFSFVGFMAGSGRWRERILLAGVVLATAAFYSLFFTQTRYRVPVEPYMIVLAAVGLQRLFPRLSSQLGNSAPEAR